MVGRMTGSALIVHSKASDPLMVSTPLVVSVSAITDPLTGDCATIPGGTVEPEVLVWGVAGGRAPGTPAQPGARRCALWAVLGSPGWP